MKPYSIVYTTEARTKIRHLHPVIKQQIRASLEQLGINPWLGKRLQRELSGVFSLRFKSYRVLYWVDENKQRIEILTLGPRKTIYEQFSKKQR